MSVVGALLLLVLLPDWDFGGGSSWDFSSPTWAFSEPEPEERPPVKVTIRDESIRLWRRPRLGQILKMPSGSLWRYRGDGMFRRVLGRDSIGTPAWPAPDGIVWFYTADW